MQPDINRKARRSSPAGSVVRSWRSLLAHKLRYPYERIAIRLFGESFEMRKTYGVLMCVMLVAGCQTAVPQSVADSQHPPSAAIKVAIVKAARDVVFDPYSIRDAEISNVVLLNGKSGVEAVCVKANAKNRLGAYAGRTAIGISIKNGVLLGATDGDPRCLDPRLTYHPFPELENLKNI